MFVRKLNKQFLRNSKLTMFISSSAVWGKFLLCIRRNGNKTTSGLKFCTKFEFFMHVLSEKRFCNAKFLEFWGYVDGGDHFSTKPPKGTSLADFVHFEPLCV